MLNHYPLTSPNGVAVSQVQHFFGLINEEKCLKLSKLMIIIKIIKTIS